MTGFFLLVIFQKRSDNKSSLQNGLGILLSENARLLANDHEHMDLEPILAILSDLQDCESSDNWRVLLTFLMESASNPSIVGGYVGTWKSDGLKAL